MKFCPKCGNQLPDEAAFCNKCGEPQPNMNQPEATPESEPRKVVAPTPVPPPSQNAPIIENPGQRYRRLLKEDDTFQGLVKAYNFEKLLCIPSILIIAVWAIALFTPVGVLTGVNVHQTGYTMFNSLGKTFPYEFSAIQLIELDNLSGNYALSPNSSLNMVFPIMSFIFGILFFVLIVLVTVLGTPKGYILKTYEAPNGAVNLANNLKRRGVPFFGALFSLPLVGTLFATYINCLDISYRDGKTYIFGEIAALTPNFITALIACLSLIALMLAGGILAKVLVNKKLKKIGL